ncbi:MAG: hypothetical protein LH645_08325 [Actinomycetia bacterium]|nr:hypothetical protein [Actinomycetes bacterium]
MRSRPVLPEDDVMDVALLGGTVTAGANTPAVSRRDRTAQCGWDGARRPLHIDDL